MKEIFRNNVLLGVLFVLVLSVASNAFAGGWKKKSDGQWGWVGDTSSSKSTGSSDNEIAAIARTRQQIRMLDDLYKTTVVLVTEHYVTDPSILSAASAAKALFAAMSKKGWHDVRLVGFTDELVNPNENSPKDEFEQTAKKKLLGGASTHEQVVTQQGKQYLRVVTQVPVVMEKCIMCHAAFEGKKGPIGGLSYTVPLIN